MKNPVLWLDEGAREAVEAAHAAAAERGDCLVEPEHLLQAIVGMPGATASRALQCLGLDAARLKSDLERAYDFPRGPLPPRSTVLSTRSRRLLEHASRAAFEHRTVRVKAEHLLFAILSEEASRAAEAMARQGIDAGGLQAALRSLEAEGAAASRPTLVRVPCSTRDHAGR